MTQLLPKTWKEVQWEKITTVDGFRRGPFGGNLKKSMFVSDGYSVYEQYSPINDDCTKFRYFIDERKYQELSSFQVKNGDFLISCSGTMGRITMVPHGAPEGVINQALLRIRLNTSYIDPDYFIKLFRSPSIQERVLKRSGGGAIQNLAAVKELKQILLPIPPLAEQKAIGEKLNSLLAQVEATKTRLEGIPGILKQFRQSVLAAAVSGELTEDWRGGVEAPSVKLSNVASFQNGFAFKSSWFTKGDKYQVVKLGNIRDGQLLLSNAPAFLSEEGIDPYLKFKPAIGDSLISMTGTRFKRDYGFACIITSEKNILINQRVGRIIPNINEISPHYLNIVLRSEQFRNAFFQGETGGVNQGNVGSKHIMSIEFPLPTFDEQKEIVKQVEELFAFADKVEAKAETALASVNHLTQSILAQAFSGELTKDWRQQNPDLISGENSAEALLERIKAERETLKPAKKTRKKKT